MKLERLVRIKSVEVLKDFWVHLEFTDGTQRDIDLEPFKMTLRASQIFLTLRMLIAKS